MHTARPIKAALAAIATTALLTLSACGSDEEAGKDEATSAPSEAPTQEPSASAEAEAASGNQPSWANPASTKGDKVSSFKAGDILVDVYQVGTAPAPKQGSWVDPETNKPLIAEGDPIVFVNYVITNEGDPIDLGNSLVTVKPRYDDWKYLQGMGGITDTALYEAQGVNGSAVKPGGYQESGVYTFGAGEQYSWGENFHQQAGSKITFEAVVVPVDAQGELLHDKRIEGKGTGTIK